MFKAAAPAVSHRAKHHGNLHPHRNSSGAMAHLYRLIVLVVLLFGGPANALLPQTSTQYITTWVRDTANVSPKVWQYSIVDACQAAFPLWNAQNSAPSAQYDYYRAVGDICEGKRRSDAGVIGLFQVANRSGQCPANSTSVTGGCQCTSPYVENATHTACEFVDPCKALKGQSAGDWWRDTGDDNGLPAKIGFSVCDKYQSIGNGLCVATVPSTGGLCMQTEGGWWRCTGQAFYTGASAATPSKCSPTGPGGSGDSPTDPLPSTPPSGNPPVAPSQPDPNTAAPAPCPAGQAPGTVNGTTVCKPIGGDRPAAADAPGTGATTTNNSDGSSTTSTTTGTTKCTDGSCNTTTNNTNVTTNAPGNNTCPAGQTAGTTTVGGQTRTTCTGTSSTSTSQAQSGFCEKNPKHAQCGGEGGDASFGGSCAGGFKAVSDDAVLNAMAEEQHKRNCEVLRTDTEPSTWVTAEGQKTGNAMEGNPNNSTVSIGPGNFDTSDALGGGGCNLNKTVVVRGYSVALPFNVLCDPLAVLGQILVAVSLLLAARIVTRG